MATQLRPAAAEDRAPIRSIAIDTELFDASDVRLIDDMLTAYLEQDAGEERWIVAEESEVIGAAYYAPELAGDRVWNLYFIGVQPARQGAGHGSALLTAVEDDLRGRAARVLIVETSGVEGFELTRQFYRKHGYDEEARIRDFYGPGDDKVVFWKALTATA